MNDNFFTALYSAPSRWISGQQVLKGVSESLPFSAFIGMETSSTPGKKKYSYYSENAKDQIQKPIILVSQ
jgi:hypothetical protein